MCVVSKFAHQLNKHPMLTLILSFEPEILAFNHVPHFLYGSLFSVQKCIERLRCAEWVPCGIYPSSTKKFLLFPYKNLVVLSERYSNCSPWLSLLSSFSYSLFANYLQHCQQVLHLISAIQPPPILPMTPLFLL